MLFVVFLFVPFFLLGNNLLNLPEMFDVKSEKQWWTKNGHEIDDSITLKENKRPIIFHFTKNKFEFKDPKHCYLDTGSIKHYSSSIGKGSIDDNNQYHGELIVKNTDSEGGKPYSYSKDKYILNGTLDSQRILHFRIRFSHSLVCRNKMKKNDYNQLKIDASGEWYPCSSQGTTAKGIVGHIVLQLPAGPNQAKMINDTVASEDIPSKPITISQAKPESSQEQPATIPKTDLTAEAGISPDNQTEESPPSQKEQNLCTPPIDDAWQEYCEAKAYNAKIRQEEEAAAKAAEQEVKEEEAYQKRLDAWNEEERQSNMEFIKSQEAEREKADKIWQEEDKAFNDSIAKEQAERKAKQAEIEKAHKIIDRFGDDYETQRAAHKKIDALSKTADTQKAKRIKNAIRKQFYDSKQIKLQADAEYQTSKAKELGKKEKYLNTVKETSLTVNKVLARIDSEIDPLKIGNKIVDLQENSYDAIDSYSKGGLSKVADDFIEKKANELSNDWAGVAKEMTNKYKQYHSKKGLKLKPDEIYYDKDGKQLKKVNAYQKVYDKKGNEVSFSFGKRIFKKTFSKLNDDYNSIHGTAEHIKNIKDGVMSGDINKITNEALDMTEKEDEDDNSKEEEGKEKER